MEQHMNDKFKEIVSDYESEDESQNNESIDDISGELGETTDKGEEAKSRKSLHNLRSNPELLADDDEIKSLMSGKKRASRNDLVGPDIHTGFLGASEERKI